jgi:hypothetical protein
MNKVSRANAFSINLQIALFGNVAIGLSVAELQRTVKAMT